MFPFTTWVHPEIVYTATEFYPPDVVEAWIRFLEGEMAFYGVCLTWKYLENNRAQVQTDSWGEEVLEMIDLRGCTLERFAKSHMSEERPL